MEEPISNKNESTLNQNIEKELIWRRNTPYFYQTLYTTEVEWPSLAVEWWVEEGATTSKNTSDQTTLCYFTYGTHTSNEEKNYLIMAKIYIPNQNYLRNKEKSIKPSDSIRKNDKEAPDIFKVQHQIEHQGQVNKIKHHPKKTNLIATRTPMGEVHIFDKTKFKTGKVSVPPALILKGQESQGFAMEWNLNKQGQIVAGSYNGKLTLWDINNKSEGKQNKILPLCDFSFHEKEVEDVSFNSYHDSIFSSCDDAGMVVLWDCRNSKFPVHSMKCHKGIAYTVQHCPLNQHMFASGGQDKLIKVWDVRNLSDSLFKCSETSGQDVFQIKWTPDDQSMLWSVAGNTMTMWDISQQKQKFVHAGHMERISQMDIHPFETESVISVDDNNEIHVFQPNRNCKL